ncbi:MAG TPA: hypothetical protein ENI86_04550 [Acidimicrobiales bacterium]|nr:hypothetical protein [Acidimicrobiales bacterium]
MQKDLWDRFDATDQIPSFSIDTEMRQFVSPDEKRHLKDSPQAAKVVTFVPTELTSDVSPDAVRVDKPVFGALRFVEYFETAVTMVPDTSAEEPSR